MNLIPQTIKKPFRMLLIDDDQFFGRIMQIKSASIRLKLDYFSSLEKLGSVASLANYDVIIFDYWMKVLNGRELAEYVSAFCPNIPVILISSDSQLITENSKWPNCVIGRVSKANGPTFILHKSIELVSSFKRLH